VQKAESAKTAKANPSLATEKIGLQFLILSPPTLAICYGVSNDGEILKMGEYLIVLLYHGLNQKAISYD